MEKRGKRDVRGLDLPRRDGGLLVVGSELGGLGGDALEDVVDEGVQDRHGAVGDTGVGVNLLEDCDASAQKGGKEWHMRPGCTNGPNSCDPKMEPCPDAPGIEQLTLVDVAGVGLLPGLGALLLVAGGSSRLLAGLLLLSRSLAGRGLAAGGGGLLGLGGHDVGFEDGN